MCEANAYIINEKGEETLFLEHVDTLVPNGGWLVLENIFGQRKMVKATIKELALVDHRIVLERSKGEQ